MTTDAGRSRHVGAVDTSLDVLEALTSLDGLTLTEIATELDLSMSSVHAHLTTWSDRGYVVDANRGYRPSLRFLEIGERVKESIDIYQSGKGPAEELAAETGEYVWLMTEENGYGVCVYKTAGERGVETGDYVLGSRWPLHCMAGGKVMLAERTNAEVNAHLDEYGMEAVTEHTITDRDRLLDELEGVRDRGVAFNYEEDTLGIRAVSAPVRRDDDSLLGTISVSGPVSRMKGRRFEEDIPEQLIEAANIIEITHRAG